jgi:hypothetical protein
VSFDLNQSPSRLKKEVLKAEGSAEKQPVGKTPR